GGAGDADARARAGVRTRGARVRRRAGPRRGRAGAGAAAGGRDAARPGRLARGRGRRGGISGGRRLRHRHDGRGRRRPTAQIRRHCADVEIVVAYAIPVPLRTIRRVTSDGELIQRAAGGDHSAFEDLYRRYARPVFGLALRRLGDRGRAEDAVQETFASIWRSAGSYKPDRGPGAPWLYAVARNAIVDRARGRTETPAD